MSSLHSKPNLGLSVGGEKKKNINKGENQKKLVGLGISYCHPAISQE